MCSVHTSVDLSAYPEPGTDEFNFLPAEEKHRLDEFHTYTAETTAGKPGVAILSMLFCENFTDEGDICFGSIELVWYQVPSEIRWECLDCGQKGTITGFENSFSDLGKLSEEEATNVLTERYGDDLDDFDLMPDQFDDFEMSQNEEEDFVHWFMNMGKNDKDTLMDELGIDVDLAQREFEKLSGGLSLGNVHKLLTAEWDDSDSPLKLNSSIPEEQFKNSLFYHNGRMILEKAQKTGIELTTRQNLKRKEIQGFMENGIWPENYIEDLRRYRKTVNEDDIWLLHSIRMLIEISGLVRPQKNKLAGYKKNDDLLKKENAGKLYTILFRTYFHEMRISYLHDIWHEFYSVQDTVPFILYRFKQLGNDWISTEKLLEEATLITAKEELNYNSAAYYKPEEWLSRLVFVPLEYFGLAESKFKNESKAWLKTPDLFKKTTLYDKFISFEF